MAKIGESKEASLDAARSILAGFGITTATSYTQEAHAAMILAGVKAILADEEKAEMTSGSKLRIMGFLQTHGVGGNHSQLKQKLFGKGEGSASKGEDDMLTKYSL